MIEAVKLRWFYFICGIFLALSLFVIANGHFWYALLIPLVFIIIYLAFFFIDVLMFLVVLSTPF
ncbi:MAG: hypothetical protein JJE25_07090, partial [Bacteroidia bacterium]|nr:hypothetical protein [Bacteroidia bacterium]